MPKRETKTDDEREWEKLSRRYMKLYEQIPSPPSESVDTAAYPRGFTARDTVGFGDYADQLGEIWTEDKERELAKMRDKLIKLHNRIHAEKIKKGKGQRQKERLPSVVQ